MAREKWRALTNKSKEMDAQCINIECVDPPKPEEPGEGYIVTVTPKSKTKPGSVHKGGFGWTEPIKRVFSDSDEVISYLKEIL